MKLQLPPSVRAVLKKPSWPGSIDLAPKKAKYGVDYDTSWTRTGPARFFRALVTDNVTRPFALALTRAKVSGAENLDPLSGAVIFAANHSSHLDTSIIISCLPCRFRHKVVVAAAADYFFDRTWKAALWSLVLGAIPVERARVNRKSADLAARLIDDGWSLVIFPEGGRSEDGWGQEFLGGASYLAKRCQVPVVPIHLRGVRPIFPKGGSAVRPGRVEVRIGRPLLIEREDRDRDRDEGAREFATRIEDAVAVLGDESETDWWSAQRRHFEGATPDRRGPDVAPWRRARGAFRRAQAVVGNERVRLQSRGETPYMKKGPEGGPALSFEPSAPEGGPNSCGC